MRTVPVPEALPGSRCGFTVTLISLIGFSAVVGDLTIRFGYYRYQTDVMVVTLVALVVLAQIVQMGATGWPADCYLCHSCLRI